MSERMANTIWWLGMQAAGAYLLSTATEVWVVGVGLLAFWAAYRIRFVAR